MLELTKANMNMFDRQTYIQKYKRDDWVKKGMYEGRCSNVAPFDWVAYLQRYEDLRKEGLRTQADAIKHWKSRGIEENRVGSKLKVYSHICVFHCGNIDIFDEIIRDHPRLNEMPLIVTYYVEEYGAILSSKGLNIIHLLRVENKGADCGPFLLCVEYLLKHQWYDKNTFFYKIHTKSIEKWRERLITDMFEISKSLKMNQKYPLLFGSADYVYNNNKLVNSENILDIIYCNTKFNIENVKKKYVNIYQEEYIDKDVNTANRYTCLIPSLNFYKNHEPELKGLTNLYHWHTHGVNEFHRKSNVNYVKHFAVFKNWFVAGTIFGFNLNYLNLFNNYKLEYEYSLLENGYLKNDNATRLHSWEYYFGMMCMLEKGIIVGNGKQVFGYEMGNEPQMKYSIINQPFSKAQVAMFMILPGKNSDSGGYRTLLKYIALMNHSGYTVDIYFGICWNDKDVHENVDELDENGMPRCKNWRDPKNHTQIETFIENIERYEVLDTKANNYYLGFKCQRDNYDVIIANAWQTAEAVYRNRHCAKRILYIIQDREELFYADARLRKLVVKTYRPEFEYYCITKYLGNYFKKNYNLSKVYESTMCVNTNIYFEKKQVRYNSVVIPYYQNMKPGRMPELVRKIITVLAHTGIKCFVYPYDFETRHPNVVNLGTQTEAQLNDLYNKHKVGIVFSNTNPSRLGFEMHCAGLHVVEYESEFTEYDMPDQWFTKIKDDRNIVTTVRKLFYKQSDGTKRDSMRNEYDDNIFLSALDI